MSTTLHEQYQALLRRGMPERRGFYLIDKAGEDAHAVKPPYFVLYCKYGGRRECDDNVARDLVTMHALRWFVKLKDRFVTVDEIQATAGQSYGGDSECSPAILDAIIAATEHLEPKTT